MRGPADRQALEHATRTAIVAVLRMLFPTLLEQTSGQEIAALLTEELTERAPEALTLRAHPDTLRAVGAAPARRPRRTTHDAGRCRAAIRDGRDRLDAAAA